MAGDVSHDFVVTTPGGVRLEVVSIEADPPLGEGFVPSMGMGLGQRNVEGNCALTYTTNTRPGFRVSFGLTEASYCIRIFDNTTIDEDAVRHYEVRVSTGA
jgi:hypothetical protein